MRWRKNDELAEGSFTHDPLAQRIFNRTQPELRRNEWREALYEGGEAGGRANGNAAAGVALVFALETLWAIASGTVEQLICEWRRARNRHRRKTRTSRIKVHYPEAP